MATQRRQFKEAPKRRTTSSQPVAEEAELPVDGPAARSARQTSARSDALLHTIAELLEAAL